MTTWGISGSFDLHLGDCNEIMPCLGSGIARAVVTDPPYGIGYSAGRTDNWRGDPRKTPRSFGRDDLMIGWLGEAFRIAEDDSFLYLFASWRNMGLVVVAAEAVGWRVVQRLAWDKGNFTMGDLRYYGSQTEDVLLFRKGEPRLYVPKRRGNIFRASRWFTAEGNHNHPSQKPEKLLREFISESTRPGDLVFDPFMGSGSTGAAAISLKRRFVGIEIDEGFFEGARKRIENGWKEQEGYEDLQTYNSDVEGQD